MKMTNKVYDVLKWIALVVLPATSVLYMGLSDVWGLPYGVEISTTISIVDTFLGALLGVSSINYAKENK